MKLVNHANVAVSYYVYNGNDLFKWVALKSGDLRANGGTESYKPPPNSTGTYFVRFTYVGGGTEIAGATGDANDTWALSQTASGGFHVSVT